MLTRSDIEEKQVGQLPMSPPVCASKKVSVKKVVDEVSERDEDDCGAPPNIKPGILFNCVGIPGLDVTRKF